MHSIWKHLAPQKLQSVSTCHLRCHVRLLSAYRCWTFPNQSSLIRNRRHQNNLSATSIKIIKIFFATCALEPRMHATELRQETWGIQGKKLQSSTRKLERFATTLSSISKALKIVNNGEEPFHTSVRGIHNLQLFHNNLQHFSKLQAQPEALDFLVTIQRTWQQYSEKTWPFPEYKSKSCKRPDI